MAGKLMMLALAAAVLAAPVMAGAQELQPRVQGGKLVVRDGQGIYETICQGCHMADAKGAEGSGKYPALAANPKVGVAAYPVRLVVLGRKGMPAFGDMMDDEQVAAVVSYVRTHFGNSYAKPVTAAEVAAQRPAKTAGRRSETAG